jgi:hypothetical protein
MTSSPRKTLTLFAVVVSVVVITNARVVPVEEFGRSVTRTLQEGDGAGFTAFMDKETMTDRALENMEGSEEFVARLKTELERGLSQVGAIVVRNLGPDVELSYLRTRTVQGVSRALVRVDLGDSGINYLDFFVHERPDGSWVVFDWLDYMRGQTYTESLRMAMALMLKEKPSLMSRLLGLSNVDEGSARRIAKMGKLSQQNDWEGWLEVYRTLPDNVRNSRVLLTTRIGVASAAGNEDEYKSAMSDLHANQGDDPTLSLALVDYYLLTGDFARAYEAVDRLDKYTGGDVALTNLRAGIALYEGDNPASIRYARRAIAQDEGYEDPYWNILVAGSRAGDFEAAMEGLRELETRFGYEFSEDELTASEDLSRLAASEAWSSARGAVVEDAEGLP